MTLIRQITILVAAIIILSGTSYIVAPELKAPEKEGITVEQALELPNPTFVDARSRDSFVAGHIPGAILLNEDEWGYTHR